MTTCMEPLCDLRKSSVEKYITISYRVAGETVREQHWIFSSPHLPFRVVRWDIRTYLPGRGIYQIGDRLEYTGKGKQYIQDVPLGTKATVTKDFGFDSRYMLEFDAPTAFHIWSSHPEGEYQGRTGMRSGGFGWTKVSG